MDSEAGSRNWVPQPDPVSGVDAEAVREALRALHIPAALAASPLARGSGMRERAALVGGKLLVESETGKGTTVRLRAPVPQKG